MKKDITYKNLFDVILAVFFVSWMFFEVMILGNKFDILKYSEFSGRLVIIIGRMVPTIAVYMFMSVWRDVRDARGFLDRILDCESHLRTVLTVLFFCALHILLCHMLAEGKGRTPLFLILAVPFAILNAGFGEVAWTGFMLQAFRERTTLFSACMLNGFLYTMYCLPLWTIEGIRDEMGEFSHFLIFCCFTSLMIGYVYRITGSVFACVCIRTILQTSAYFYSDMIFASPAVTLLLLAETIVLALAASKLGKY